MADPFISRQDLTDFLGRDVTSDAGALAAVDSACDICRVVAEQTFTAGTSTIRLDGTDTDCLMLPERPVTNAGSVTVDGVSETEFEFTRSGKLLRGTAGSGTRPTWPAGRLNVGVTYEHGYGTADMPRDVAMVALFLSARIIVQGIAGSENLGGAASISYSQATADDLTKNEERILKKYRPQFSGTDG